MRDQDLNPDSLMHAVDHSYGIPSFPLTIPKGRNAVSVLA